MAGHPLTVRAPLPAALLAAVLAILLAPGCLSGRYERSRADRVPTEEAVASLAPDHSHMTDVLAALGAPLDAWEGPRGGVVLAYGGLDRGGWSLRASVPTGKGPSPYFQYSDADAATEGYLFLFDADLVLRVMRRGNLRDLMAGME